MASNEGEDNSQDLRNSDESKSFKVIGGCLRASTVKVRRKLACKFRDTDDPVREIFETEVKRLGSLASSCRAGKDASGLDGTLESEPQLVTVSSQVFPDHNEFVPQDLNEGNLESVESVDSLKAQLQEERLLYNRKISELEIENEEQASAMEERTKKTLEECKRLELKLSEAEKEKKNVDKKYTQVVSRVGKLVSDLKEEQEFNKCLLENQKLWQEKLKQTEEKLLQEETARKQEVSDLQEQLADLMHHLETQQAIASAPDETRRELQDGAVFLARPSRGPYQPRKMYGKKGRKR